MPFDIVPYDFSRLRGKIVEVCGTQGEFAHRMGLSTHTMTQKMNSRVPFNQNEIDRAVGILSLCNEDIPAYFFVKKVQKYEQM